MVRLAGTDRRRTAALPSTSWLRSREAGAFHANSVPRSAHIRSVSSTYYWVSVAPPSPRPPGAAQRAPRRNLGRRWSKSGPLSRRARLLRSARSASAFSGVSSVVVTRDQAAGVGLSIRRLDVGVRLRSACASGSRAPRWSSQLRLWWPYKAMPDGRCASSTRSSPSRVSPCSDSRGSSRTSSDTSSETTASTRARTEAPNRRVRWWIASEPAGKVHNPGSSTSARDAGCAPRSLGADALSRCRGGRRRAFPAGVLGLSARLRSGPAAAVPR